jgi:predicted O-methyltransferase YrrM
MADEDSLMRHDPANFLGRRELGTSYGYSTLFLADATRRTGGKVYCIDIAANKQRYARQQIEDAGLGKHVEWMLGDATEQLKTLDGPFDFVSLDLWKDKDVRCFDLFLGNSPITQS